MRKLGTLILGAILTLGIGAGISFKPNTDVAKAAETTPYTYEFTEKKFSGNGEVDLNGIKWTLSGDGGFWGYDGNYGKGQQFGSGSKPYKSLSLKAYFPNVTSVSINTSGASSIDASLSVYIGETEIGSTKITTTATNYTFTADALTGTLDFRYTQTSSKAMYIKSISVTYSGDASDVPEKVVDHIVATKADEEKVWYIGNEVTKEDLTVSVYYDGGENNLIDDYEIINGVIASTSHTVTVSYLDGEYTDEVVFTATEATASEYTLITSVAQLKIGSNIVIAAKESNVAMSTTQNSNNRGQTSITKSGNSITDPSNQVQIFTLEKGTNDDTYAFNTGSGYIYAASSSSNHLKTQNTNNANGSWSIEIATDGTATIKAQGSNTRNWLRYNSSSSIFSCYSSGQADIVIYSDEINLDPTIIINPINDNEILPGETGTLTVQYNNITGTPAVNWTSSNTSVATINATTGEYNALSAGSTEITASVEYENQQLTAVIELIVSKPASVETVEISEILTYQAASSKVIRVIGKVTEISHSEYGNIYIKSLDSDDTIYVYGCTRDTSKLTEVNSGEGYYNGTYSSGKSFNNACEENDVIVLEAIVGTYNSKVQLQGVIYDPTAKLLADEIYVRAGGWENDKTTTNCAKNYAFAKALFLGLSSTEQAAFKGAEYIDAATTYVNWCSANSDTNPYGPAQTARALIINNTSTTVIAIILGSIVLVISAGLLISKKRRYSK